VTDRTGKTTTYEVRSRRQRGTSDRRLQHETFSPIRERQQAERDGRAGHTTSWTYDGATQDAEKDPLVIRRSGRNDPSRRTDVEDPLDQPPSTSAPHRVCAVAERELLSSRTRRARDEYTYKLRRHAGDAKDARDGSHLPYRGLLQSVTDGLGNITPTPTMRTAPKAERRTRTVDGVVEMLVTRTSTGTAAHQGYVSGPDVPRTSTTNRKPKSTFESLGRETNTRTTTKDG